jgi:hypothetical protein
MKKLKNVDYKNLITSFKGKCLNSLKELSTGNDKAAALKKLAFTIQKSCTRTTLPSVSDILDDLNKFATSNGDKELVGIIEFLFWLRIEKIRKDTNDKIRRQREKMKADDATNSDGSHRNTCISRTKTPENSSHDSNDMQLSITSSSSPSSTPSKSQDVLISKHGENSDQDWLSDLSDEECGVKVKKPTANILQDKRDQIGEETTEAEGIGTVEANEEATSIEKLREKKVKFPASTVRIKLQIPQTSISANRVPSISSASTPQDRSQDNNAKSVHKKRICADDQTKQAASDEYHGQCLTLDSGKYASSNAHGQLTAMDVTKSQTRVYTAPRISQLHNARSSLASPFSQSTYTSSSPAPILMNLAKTQFPTMPPPTSLAPFLPTLSMHPAYARGTAFMAGLPGTSSSKVISSPLPPDSQSSPIHFPIMRPTTSLPSPFPPTQTQTRPISTHGMASVFGFQRIHSMEVVRPQLPIFTIPSTIRNPMEVNAIGTGCDVSANEEKSKNRRTSLKKDRIERAAKANLARAKKLAKTDCDRDPIESVMNSQLTFSDGIKALKNGEHKRTAISFKRKHLILLDLLSRAHNKGPALENFAISLQKRCEHKTLAGTHDILRNFGNLSISESDPELARIVKFLICLRVKEVLRIKKNIRHAEYLREEAFEGENL